MCYEKMTTTEHRSTIALAVIMSLRMLGLFMILPVFTLYANNLIGATPALIGLAMGVYGLTQGALQIPFGILSDYFGRKRIIIIGLGIFILGSIIAANSATIFGVILGRALQGAGAIGSTIIAMIADLTREQQRTKAMAICGMTIGLSFSLAMILGPVFSSFINVNGIFWLSAGLGVVAIIILLKIVATPLHSTWHPDAESDPTQFSALLKNSALMNLNIGIFILHTVLTANFVILPLSLQNLAGLHGNEQWLLYLPILIIAFLFSLPIIISAEKKHYLKEAFVGAIILLAMSEYSLALFANHMLASAICLLVFFTAFSVLEAFLPSLVSKTAPTARKGTALGIYSCSQFLGIFAGGTLGGWIYGAYGLTSVYLFCMGLSIIWLAIAFQMKKLHYSGSRI